MSHPHSHHHISSQLTATRAFVAGIILNSIFVVTEIVAGIATNSLALLSDAWHNLSDISSLALSLFALKVAHRKTSSTYTYGYNKGTILASLVNAVILLIAVGSIGWEAIQRFMLPEPAEGTTISIVAAIGIVINTVSALLFFKEKDKELNARAAYLHLAMDALVSLGVVIAGLLIYYTGLPWLDPLVSLLIMAVVIYSTWGVLKESLRLSLDAVPRQIDLKEIKSEIKKNEGVIAVYHVHIWAMSTTTNALTAHLVISKDLGEERTTVLKEEIRHQLQHLGIQHATFETELR